MKANWRGKVTDDVSCIDLIDSEDQRLTFRVGGVFFDKGPSKIGLWVWYQAQNLKTDESGPVLMDEASWKQIRNFIDQKFKGFHKNEK